MKLRFVTIAALFILSFAIAGGLLLLNGFSVLAQDKIIAPGASDSQIDVFFKPIDTNNDRAISFEEFSVKQQSNFAKLDTDQNGQITLAEYTVEVQSKPDNLAKETSKFVSLDKDQDGNLTIAEFEAPRRQQFDDMDANCDGQMSWPEFAATVRNKPMPKSC
ncbi:EF-hand domain-containing protein [Hypericibacter sp.]|uniref:EF-hand domain-containing protein n=1 Tax=Hypericibacter sp. TaxID=2705401 RepID=UPI003D6DA48A